MLFLNDVPACLPPLPHPSIISIPGPVDLDDVVVCIHLLQGRRRRTKTKKTATQSGQRIGPGQFSQKCNSVFCVCRPFSSCPSTVGLLSLPDMPYLSLSLSLSKIPFQSPLSLLSLCDSAMLCLLHLFRLLTPRLFVGTHTPQIHGRQQTHLIIISFLAYPKRYYKPLDQRSSAQPPTPILSTGRLVSANPQSNSFAVLLMVVVVHTQIFINDSLVHIIPILLLMVIKFLLYIVHNSIIVLLFGRGAPATQEPQ